MKMKSTEINIDNEHRSDLRNPFGSNDGRQASVEVSPELAKERCAVRLVHRGARR
jgi:hypothetical protein